jgi:hypothetical protein
MLKKGFILFTFAAVIYTVDKTKHKRKSECKDCVISSCHLFGGVLTWPWNSLSLFQIQHVTVSRYTPVDVLEFNYNNNINRNFMWFQIKNYVTWVLTAQCWLHSVDCTVLTAQCWLYSADCTIWRERRWTISVHWHTSVKYHTKLWHNCTSPWGTEWYQMVIIYTSRQLHNSDIPRPAHSLLGYCSKVIPNLT